MRTSRTALAVMLSSLVFAESAQGLDQPIDAVKLVLKRTATRETLVFLSRDPAFLFPPPGSADDPATGSPGGLIVDVFSANEGGASHAVPPGVGNPGWTVTVGSAPRFRFRNSGAPAVLSSVRSALVKQGRVIKVMGRVTGLSLAGPQGAVGVRITTGTRRSCALFGAATIKKDEAGVFVAKGALASSLSDCSDGSLGGTTATTTTLPGCQIIPDPFEPTCGGSCPVGGQCVDEIGPNFQQDCACIPAGATACNGSGYPTCGGVCGGSRVCQAFHLLPGETPEIMGCACVDPGNTCDDPAGTCFAIGVCSPGSVCVGQGPPTSSCGCGPP